MQDRTITATFKALRLQLIREDGSGLQQVEALLAIQGCNLGPAPRPGVISVR